MPESTITARGQTTVPAPIREALALAPGDRLRYVLLDRGEVRLMRAAPVAALAGRLKRQGQRPVDLAAMEEAVAGGAAES
jgi:antitoxin PrlF